MKSITNTHARRLTYCTSTAAALSRTYFRSVVETHSQRYNIIIIVRKSCTALRTVDDDSFRARYSTGEVNGNWSRWAMRSDPGIERQLIKPHTNTFARCVCVCVCTTRHDSLSMLYREIACVRSDLIRATWYNQAQWAQRSYSIY